MRIDALLWVRLKVLNLAQPVLLLESDALLWPRPSLPTIAVFIAIGL